MSSIKDSQLIADLHKLSKKSPKLVKSSTYPAPDAPDITVRSWKMNEFKYYDIPSPFPTLARGLFTIELPKEDGGSDSDDPNYRIVARGYDKFFNIGEVPWTTWQSLEAHTGPPYTLSLKSNGCIIFIAALSPSQLLVTSKHSLGPVQGVDESHAQAGHRWLRKHLADKDRTEEELARTLWEHNWTAVAELCDDNFEEHVLPYAPENTGLHLHGLNDSTKDFATQPPDAVDAFAAEWGFITTLTTKLDSIPTVREFTQEVGKTGKWRGEALEGFVVRSHVTAPPTEGREHGGAVPAASPYAPGSAFFFKVKFDEPYMMYRDWRELTKMLLSTKGRLSEARLPKNKMRRPETRLYVRWVTEEIQRDRASFDKYSKGKGIIATRERFLRWMEAGEGHAALERERQGKEPTIGSGGNEKPAFGKTVIMPVAIPGCGKTAVAVALTHLFGFAHTQSDDVDVKKAAPAFIRNVVSLLKTHDVVIADKNNHLRQHRQQLRDATVGLMPPVRLLALNWSLDKPQATLHRVCGDRVLQRGDNHQTLRADTSHVRAHEDVLWRFLTQSEPFAESEADENADIDVEVSLEDMLSEAIDACVRILGVERPSPKQLEEALAAARGYAPTTKKPDSDKKKKDDKPLTPRYFALLPEVDLDNDVGKQLVTASQECRDFWSALKGAGRFTQRPHVTIAHRNSLPDEVELWERCMGLHRMSTPPLFRLSLGHAVWNDRVMALTVDEIVLARDVGGQVQADAGQEGDEFVAKLPHDVRERLHITVGTRDPKVMAVEAKELVERWRRGEAIENGGVIALEGMVTLGRIEGMFS